MENFSKFSYRNISNQFDEPYLDAEKLSCINVILICGLPGVGKTYFAEKMKFNLISEIDKMNKFTKKYDVEIFIFNFDNFLFSEEDLLKNNNFEFCNNDKNVDKNGKNKLNFDFTIFNKKRKGFFEHFKKKINELTLEYDIKNDKKYIFLLDDNFYFRSMRKPFYKTCELLNTRNEDFNIPIATYLEVHLKASQEYCLSLNSIRKGIECLPEYLINKMEAHFEWDPYHTDLNYVLEITGQDTLEDKNIPKITKEIINKLNQNLSILFNNAQTNIRKNNKTYENKKQNKAILIDFLETEIRKKVKELIVDRKHLAKSINENKKTFMNFIKSILNKKDYDIQAKEINYFELFLNVSKLKENDYIINDLTQMYIKGIIDLFNS